jgi:hypothetical protein
MKLSRRSMCIRPLSLSFVFRSLRRLGDTTVAAALLLGIV